MTIDWTQPCETDEDPPRPVRVLFDKDGGATHVEIGEYVYTLSPGKAVLMQQPGLRLRNVAPPKPEPVLREAWVWWNSHGKATLSLNEGWCVHQRTVERGVYARVAVMSDGSPVPASPEQFDQMREMAKLIQDRDAWRIKAEALQAEVDKRNDSILDHLARIQAMKPVVGAAVAYYSIHLTIDNIRRARALESAVRTYQQTADFNRTNALGLDTWHSCGLTPKKTPAEAVANVEKIGPVRNCTSCIAFEVMKPNCPYCCQCADEGYSKWEPRHD